MRSILLLAGVIDERVTVPAGTFSCYHYAVTAPDSSFDNHFYYAPDVGNVRNEYNDRAPYARTPRAVFELTAYELT